jgi:hypothetical protein
VAQGYVRGDHAFNLQEAIAHAQRTGRASHAVYQQEDRRRPGQRRWAGWLLMGRELAFGMLAMIEVAK